MQVSNYAYPTSAYDYKLYCLLTLKKAEETGLITPSQYEDKQKEFLKAITFIAGNEQADSNEDFKDKNNVDNFNLMARYQDLDASVDFYNVPVGESGHDYDDGEMVPHDGSIKYRTFSEFIYGALTELGGTASLSKIYQYVFAHQGEIDAKFAYRFNKKGDYKSNVRSTLHNTGAFAQLPNGDWTVSSHLRTRR